MTSSTISKEFEGKKYGLIRTSKLVSEVSASCIYSDHNSSNHKWPATYWLARYSCVWALAMRLIGSDRTPGDPLMESKWYTCHHYGEYGTLPPYDQTYTSNIPSSNGFYYTHITILVQ